MAASQQQTQSHPEDAWIPFVKSIYPNHLHKAYFFPPIFLSRVPFAVDTVAEQTARVTINQPPQASATKQRSRAKRKPQQAPPPPPPPPESTAGKAWTENPAGLKEERYLDSDLKGDKAQHHCLKALEKIDEVMMVVSQMMFRKYLDVTHNPHHHTNPTNIISQLRTVEHLPQKIADGECDIIILHRQYGILVGEVKSVGGPHLEGLSQEKQDRDIAKVVKKALDQLNNQEIALNYLVGDMAGGQIRVMKTFLLPNIASAQLLSAVKGAQQEMAPQEFIQCTGSQDVPQAVSRCLCSDDLEEPQTWWNALWTGGPDPCMSDSIYERLLARFCGPASTVTIPTAGHPRRELRDLGQAVAETSLRLSSLVLTRKQLEQLNDVPGPQYMYLQGPPGCGKTVVLILKALQWALQGMDVVVIGRPEDLAVSMLVEQQLAHLVRAGAAAAGAGRIRRHVCNYDDVQGDLAQLKQLLGVGPGSGSGTGSGTGSSPGSGPGSGSGSGTGTGSGSGPGSGSGTGPGSGTNPEAFFLCDEVPHLSDDFLPWLKEVANQLPDVRVWAAGLRRWDNDAQNPLPGWLDVGTLSEPLRCPPAVTKQVETTGAVDGHIVPEYSQPVLPLPTEGPEALKREHKDEADHCKGRPWQCDRCADSIADVLKELRVGQPGRPQHKDVWVLCEELTEASDAQVIVNGLRTRHGVPVRALSRPPSEDDARELALAVKDEVVVTEGGNVQGLERAVIIALGPVDIDGDYRSWSRSTGILCLIG